MKYLDYLQSNYFSSILEFQLDIQPTDNYYDLMKKSLVWMNNREFRKLLKPFDKREFDVSPAIVNAFYSPEKNSISRIFTFLCTHKFLLIVSTIRLFCNAKYQFSNISIDQRYFLQDIIIFETFILYSFQIYGKTIRSILAFPAGILQPPFFSGEFPKAVNYGAVFFNVFLCILFSSRLAQ